jgi:probable F420-dependent oxidoreductase
MTDSAESSGFTLPISPLSPRQVIPYAIEAQSLGYSECWLAEAVNDESFALAGAIAALTSMRVATGIVPVFNRSPLLLAMAASTLSRLTDGNFVLGLGSSTPLIIENWNGVTYSRPVTRMRESIEVIRGLLAGVSVTFDGREVAIERARLEAPPEPPPPPIHVAALNRRMCELTGEVADGIVINMLGPEHVQVVLADVATGAARANRDPAEIEVVVRLQVALGASAAEGRARARAAFGPYVAASGYNQFFRRIGFEEEAEAVTVALAAGDREGVAHAFTDALADALVVYGDAADCRARFDEYRAAGVDKIVSIPLVDDEAGCWSMLRGLAPSARQT